MRTPTLSTCDILADRYRIVRLIGVGGMGEVYQAEDPLLEDELALKVLPPRFSTGTGLERFKREIQLARRVTHPNICRVFDVGQHTQDGQPVLFFTMELLDGETLGQRLRRAGPLAAGETLDLVRQMAAGLDAAHAAGIVHRDFKSDNVILASKAGARPRAVITDFGVARPARPEASELTGVGDIVGTLAYMAPEQLAGQATTAVDIYSLGVVIYEMLTGSRPFPATTEALLARLRDRTPPVSPRQHVPGLDERWEAAILRCLEIDPGRRFARAGGVAEALPAVQAGDDPLPVAATMAARPPALPAPSDPQALLVTGQTALQAGSWQEARASFEAALASGGPPEAMLGLASALFWLGDVPRSMEYIERAYTGFRHRPEPMMAAVCALRLAGSHKSHLMNAAAAAGWLARGERLIEEHDLAPLRGMLLVSKAVIGDDPVEGEGFARQALEMGRRAGDIDLELIALCMLGASLIEQGRVQEGMKLLDEGMAGSLSGEVKSLDTVVFTCCITMTTVTRCADLERAAHWVRASRGFASRHSIPFLNVECRTRYARVLVAMGEWARAEEAATQAMAQSKDQVPSFYADARATLAGLRVSQGRIGDAEGLLRGGEREAPSVPVVARIQLISGKPALATSLLTRQLDAVKHDRLASAELEELLGEAESAQGHDERAAERGRALAAVGEAGGCKHIAARGHRLWGRALAHRDGEEARRQLELAVDELVRLRWPYEAARTRVLLAEALRGREPDLARMEASTALAAFEDLGAARDAAAAAALVQQLDAAMS